MKSNFIFLIFIFTFFLVSCSSVNVNNDHNKSFDFTKLSTYKILKELPKLPDGSQMPSLTYNLIASAVDLEMSKRGIGKNELLANFGIDWHTSLDEKVYKNVNSLTNWESNFSHDETGMLILDIVDLESGNVIWRGWAKEVLTSQNLEEKISDSVSKILSQYPPENILGLNY